MYRKQYQNMKLVKLCIWLSFCGIFFLTKETLVSYMKDIIYY